MGDTLKATPRRSRVVAAAIVGGLLVLTTVVGLVFAVLGVRGTPPGRAQSGATTAPPSSPSGAGSSTSSPPSGVGSKTVQQQMDEFAAEPMVVTTEADAQQAPLTSRTAGPSLQLPAPTDTTQLVAVYPHTLEGAVAQLAAIEKTALLNFSPDNARRVYQWAALPGAPKESVWNPVAATLKVQEGITERGGSPDDVTADWQLMQAQVKGVATGGDAAVVCVLGLFEQTAKQAIGPTQTKQIPWPDCQRMVWHDGRWRIGSGAQPVWAPITWPGTDAAVRAKWVGAIPHA